MGPKTFADSYGYLDNRLTDLESERSEIKSSLAETSTALKYISLQVSEGSVRLSDEIKSVKSSVEDLSQKVQSHEKSLDLIAAKEVKMAKFKQTIYGLLGTIFGTSFVYLAKHLYDRFSGH